MNWNDLDKNSLVTLRKTCHEQGIKFSPKTKKSQLIQLLKTKVDKSPIEESGHTDKFSDEIDESIKETSNFSEKTFSSGQLSRSPSPLPVNELYSLPIYFKEKSLPKKSHSIDQNNYLLKKFSFNSVSNFSLHIKSFLFPEKKQIMLRIPKSIIMLWALSFSVFIVLLLDPFKSSKEKHMIIISMIILVVTSFWIYQINGAYKILNHSRSENQSIDDD